jgi:hypothetical protein
MYGYLSEWDILVIIYPNKLCPKSVIIIDPLDKKIMQYEAYSVEHIKEILRNYLPFCNQGHSPFIHGGRAYIVDWTDLPESLTYIIKPEDIERIKS